MNNKIHRMIMLLLILLLGAIANAQTWTFLSLNQEGQASVCIPYDNKMAYIIDGGKYGELDTELFWKELYDQGIRRIVIICSHPHADHLNGLLEKVKYKTKLKGGIDLAKFDEVVFVDSGYPAEKSLRTVFESVHGANHPGVQSISAYNKNVFRYDMLTKYNKEDCVVFVWSHLSLPKGHSTPHGNSIITHAVLSFPNNNKSLIIDFDDANEKLLKEWMVAVGANLPDDLTQIIFSTPHHCSDTTDLASLVSFLRKKNCRIDAVISANSGNRHMHPGPNNWITLIEQVGIGNIHITGGEGNIVIDESGVNSNSQHKYNDINNKIIVPLIKKYQLRRQCNIDKYKSKSVKNIKSINAFNEAAKCVNTINNLYWNKANEYGINLVRTDPINIISDIDLKETVNKQIIVVADKGPKGGTGNYKNTLQKIPGHQNKMNRIKAFHISTAEPTFGGVVIGNKVSDKLDLSIGKVSFKVRKENIYGNKIVIPEIHVFKDKEGKELLGIYDDITVGELWSAYHYVKPDPNWYDVYGLANIKCNLIGRDPTSWTTLIRYFIIPLYLVDTNYAIIATQLYQVVRKLDSYNWKFVIHPAIANTRLAEDAMVLDMLIFSMSQSKTGYYYDTYQWCDDESEIDLKKDSFTVSSKKVTILELYYYEPKKNEVKEGKNSTKLSRKNFNTNEIVEELYKTFPAVRNIDRFARIVAFLNWITDNGSNLPDLPEEIDQYPIHYSVPPRLSRNNMKAYVDKYQLLDQKKNSTDNDKSEFDINNNIYDKSQLNNMTIFDMKNDVLILNDSFSDPNITANLKNNEDIVPIPKPPPIKIKPSASKAWGWLICGSGLFALLCFLYYVRKKKRLCISSQQISDNHLNGSVPENNLGTCEYEEISCINEKCPKILRVPIDKGNLHITCPHCKSQWDYSPSNFTIS